MIYKTGVKTASFHYTRKDGSEATYAYHDHGRAAAPGRVASTDDAARRAVERAVGADEGALW